MLLRGQKVLIVEPEAFSAYALEGRVKDLEAEGVIVARKFEEAAHEAWDRHGVGLAIIDCEQFGERAEQLAERLRALDIRVICTRRDLPGATGTAGPAETDEAASGADDVGTADGRPGTAAEARTRMVRPAGRRIVPGQGISGQGVSGQAISRKGTTRMAARRSGAREVRAEKVRVSGLRARPSRRTSVPIETKAKAPSRPAQVVMKPYLMIDIERAIAAEFGLTL